MSLLLFSDVSSCIASLAVLAGDDAAATAIVLHADAPLLVEPLLEAFPQMAAVDIGSARFSRLNFDGIGMLVLDFPPASLESSPGRRLVDVLGRLASEGLALVFVGESVSVVGGVLLDGVRAGLNLVPGTAVIADMRAVADMRTLLGALQARGTRLLAMDAPIAVRYDARMDRVRVLGPGSVLLAGFRPAVGDEPPAAQLHVLTTGMESAWPA